LRQRLSVIPTKEIPIPGQAWTQEELDSLLRQVIAERKPLPKLSVPGKTTAAINNQRRRLKEAGLLEISFTGLRHVPWTIRDLRQLAHLTGEHGFSAAFIAQLQLIPGRSRHAISKMMGEVTCFGDNASNDLVGMRVALIPPDILRGMLAEAAFKRDGNGVQALQPLPIQQIYQRNWFAVTGRHVTVDEMGACIADTNPAGVLALARSVPTSKEESAAFTALGPNLGACLRAGTKLQASRQALRAALSEALYQRLNAPFATPAVEAAKK